MDMVEKVARALAEGGHLGVSVAFRPVLDTDKGSIPLLKARDTERAMAAARAAIEAMREPSLAMLERGVWQSNHFPSVPEGYEAEPIHRFALTQSWRAMIDAALTETPP